MPERPKAIRERIPRKLGLIQLGSRLGNPIKPPSEGQEPTRITISGFTDSHADYYTTKVEVTGPDTIRVYEEASGGYSNERFFKGPQINTSPAKSKLRWA